MTETATLADVARLAGVSLATASRALNGAPGRTVRADLKERVERAASDLRYSPNAQAQAIARGTSSTVGLIVHDIADPYFSTIAAGVIRAAELHGLIVNIASTESDPTDELRHLKTLRQQRARGVLLAGSRTTDSALGKALRDEIRDAARSGMGAACIGQGLSGVNTLSIRNREASAALAIELHDLGYRRFAILAGPRGLVTARDRTEGFADALAKLGSPVDPKHVIPTQFTRDGGYAGTAELLRTMPDDVELIFAVNDVMAVGAMAALRDHGVPIPERMAVAGFDDIATLRDIVPALTTVRIPLQDIGSQALELALSQPNAGNGAGTTIKVDGEVVLRETTPGVRR